MAKVIGQCRPRAEYPRPPLVGMVSVSCLSNGRDADLTLRYRVAWLLRHCTLVELVGGATRAPSIEVTHLPDGLSHLRASAKRTPVCMLEEKPARRELISDLRGWRAEDPMDWLTAPALRHRQDGEAKAPTRWRRVFVRVWSSPDHRRRPGRGRDDMPPWCNWSAVLGKVRIDGWLVGNTREAIQHRI